MSSHRSSSFMTHPYASLAYAEAYEGFDVIEVPAMGAYVLKRPIPNSDHYDAMGPYPMTPLNSDSDYNADFALLREQGLVSLVLVADTFIRPDPAFLQSQFDHCVEYKEHFVHDLRLTDEERKFSKHHRYEVRKSLRACEVRVIELRDHLDAWCGMYDMLVERHGITGIQAFPRAYFEQLCAVQPMMTMGAFEGGELISAHIWLEHEGHVYSHLAASNDKGYASGAAYPIYAQTIEYYAEQGARILDFGGGAGATEASAGLARFKKGFSTGAEMNYVLGKVLDDKRYAELRADKPRDGFFPAYRQP